MLDTFIFLLHILPNIVGLLLNTVLFVLARYRSPRAIKKYSLLILNFAVCDSFACLTSLFVCQRIIPDGTSLFFISEGPCKYFGARTCYISYSVMLHLYAHTLYSTLLSFSFRYYVLSYRLPSRSTLKLIILLIYLPSFTQMVLFSFADDPPEILEPLLQAKHPDYNLTGRVITGHLNVFEWKALATILHMTLPITPVYICILVLRKETIRHLIASTMSPKTRHLHHQLLNALSWQSCLPLFYLYAVISYACGQLGIYHHPYLEHSTFISMGFIPALSPIASLYFVKPYRDCIQNVIVHMEKKLLLKESCTTASPASFSLKYCDL